LKKFILNSYNGTLAPSESANLRILLATSAASAGIHSKHCVAVFKYGFPRSLVDLVQELGRAGRRSVLTEDLSDSYKLFVNVQLYCSLLTQIYKQGGEGEDNNNSDSSGTIFMIESIDNLHQVLKFVVAPGKCQHLFLENYLTNRNGVQTDLSACECEKQCYYCVSRAEHSVLATKLVNRKVIIEGLTRLFSNGYVSVNEVQKWFKQNEAKLWPTDQLNGWDRPTLAQICVLRLLSLSFFDVKVNVAEKGNATNKVKVKFSMVSFDKQTSEGILYNHQIDLNWNLMTWI